MSMDTQAAMQWLAATGYLDQLARDAIAPAVAEAVASVVREQNDRAAALRGARLALEAAADECDDLCAAHEGLDESASECLRRIRALSPESVVDQP